MLVVVSTGGLNSIIMNPELRQTLNTISRNFESANEVAQENIYTFTQLVVDPCIDGFKTAINDCTTACFPARDDRFRRKRARSRGRSDLHFDFYDDWDEEENGAFAAASWGNDELDSLLAGRGVTSRQPGRQRGMTYGTRNRRPAHAPNEDNPNIIPSSSYLGFLERFKWRPGARGLRYKPSAAGLQEHPNALARDEVEPLIEESEDEEDERLNHIARHKRQRSDTQASGSTSNSLSSRGDLIMGDEEDDAQPLGDEFAVMLTKQNTNSSKRPSASRKSTRTTSTKSNKSIHSRRSDSSKSFPATRQSPVLESIEVEPPSMAALKAEEDRLRHEQEMEIAQKREAATQLAKERRLDGDAVTPAESVEDKTPENEPETDPQQRTANATAGSTPLRSPSTSEIEQRLGLGSPLSNTTGSHGDSETEPFPSFPTTPVRDEHQDDHPP